LGIFSHILRRNGYLCLTPPFAPAISISYKTDEFSLPSDAYGTYLTFLFYYVAWPVTLTFDLLALTVFHT